MHLIIDAHEDLAYNTINFGRDYTRAAAETRQLELNTENPGRAGNSLLGWPDYQRGQVAMVFPTIFVASKEHKSDDWDQAFFEDFEDAHRQYMRQIDLYHRWAEQSPDQFMLVGDRRALHTCLNRWEQTPADYPAHTNPVGLVLLLEGIEGLRRLEDLESYWQRGLRIIGPVWGGGRFCGCAWKDPGGFTGEGRELLEAMADMGFILDIAHMNEKSALEALDIYEGTIIASHANARALIKNAPSERHFTDPVIRRLAKRDGVIGLLPFNNFLKVDWKIGDDRHEVPLALIADHMDHICQIAGSAGHVGLGTDFDGGFGWPAVPEEIDTIADLQKLENILSERGYSAEQVAAFFAGNWLRILEKALPA